MCSLEKRGNIFILTITGDDEHRLKPTLIDSIRAALTRAKSESESMGPTALITTSQGKFFSNGFDLSWAFSDPDPVRTQTQSRLKAMSKKLRLLAAELISLPMPTIAAVTGHASSGGFIVALCHDYILMRKDRGVLYMSELDIKMKLPGWFMAILKSKIASPKILREVILKAAKIRAEMGVEWGIVDSAHENADETMAAALKLGMDMMKRNWDGKVYADNRKTVLSDILTVLGSDETVEDSGDNVDDDGNEIKAISRL